jgi:hypothetical protein
MMYSISKLLLEAKIPTDLAYSQGTVAGLTPTYHRGMAFHRNQLGEQREVLDPRVHIRIFE